MSWRQIATSYFRLSLLNLGATQADASFDVDGAIYTMKYYSKIGRALAEGKMLKEGARFPFEEQRFCWASIF